MTLLYDPTTKNLVESQSIQSGPKYGLLVPNRLFVGGLGAEITEEDLRSFFSSYGPIKHCKILSDSNGMSKGYGFVTFVSTEDVEKLLKKEGEQVVYKDRKLNIGPAVRKQGTLPQVLGNPQTVAAMSIGQGGLVYANGVPCMVQGTNSPMMNVGTGAAMLPLQEGIAYPQLVSLPTGGVQMMMVHPQYLAHSGSALLHHGSASAGTQSSALSRGSLQLGNALPLHIDHATGLSQILAPAGGTMGVSSAALLHGLAQQSVMLSAPAMTSGSPTGLEQYLCQFPYLLHHHQQQQQQQQQHALLQQQLQSADVLGSTLSGVEMIQQKLQKQQYALAEGISSQLQYFELPRSLTQSPSSGPPNSGPAQTPSCHHQTIASASGKTAEPANSSLGGGETKGAGIKRVLNIPYQTVCTPTYTGSVYGLPAVKILAGQGQQRIVTQALDPSDIQVLAKNLK